MRRVLGIIAIVTMVLTACADDDGPATEATEDAPATTAATPASTPTSPATTAAPTTTTTTTTAAPPVEAEEIELPDDVVSAVNFAPMGPFAAGVTTLEAADGLVVEVWYPTTETGDGETYSLGEWSPELVVAILGDRLPEQLTLAVRDAAPASGRFPLAVFSHGFGSFRTQSAEIATSLASWGFVVAAPDHTSRGLEALLLGGVTEGDDVADLVAARDTVLASELRAVIAGGQVVAFGHSAGGRASAEAIEVLGAAGWVGFAPGGDVPSAVPATVIAGGADAIIELDRIEAAWEASTSTDKRLAVFADAGHQAFSDLCNLVGEPLPDLAADLGLPLPDEVGLLATDGCLPGQLIPTQAAPAIEHLTVATFRAALGIGDPVAPFADDLLAEFDDLGLTVVTG
ncbi:MAG: hypothetical protein AAFZ07_21595 [Actinomycetota bacterium]